MGKSSPSEVISEKKVYVPLARSYSCLLQERKVFLDRCRLLVGGKFRRVSPTSRLTENECWQY